MFIVFCLKQKTNQTLIDYVCFYFFVSGRKLRKYLFRENVLNNKSTVT